MARGAFDQDPLAVFHAPPPNETPQERVLREAKEVEAKKVSDQIDEQLKADRAALKKQKSIVRVLLLGQAESGKSTTLKNFRMRYARDAWIAERTSWRSVIQLNLIRSIITIVETLQAELGGESPELDTPPHVRSGISASSESNSPVFKTASPLYFGGDSMPQQLTKRNSSSLLNGKHQLLNLRLGPLRRVEADLKRRLGAQAHEEEEGVAASLGSPGEPRALHRHKKEFGVCHLTQALAQSQVSQKNTRGSDHSHGNVVTDSAAVDEVTEVIASCKDDMAALWSDPAVRTVLQNWNVRLEDSAGFFLNDLERIASRNYEPSDDDVVRARLRTLGVQEYKIEFASHSTNIFSGGVQFGEEWRLYDVGGSRTMRHAWLPYFDNVQAIIFLAPVSCFDQRLSEDSTVNRLEDSFLLWQTVCASKLLAKANMILFLNKIDLLDRKLRSGVKVNQYLPSYGGRGNDTGTVVRYLRSKFKDILKHSSTEERSSYYYATTVIDTKATASTIHAVKDTILRDYLKEASFI